jgi:hypothetical protein
METASHLIFGKIEHEADKGEKFVQKMHTDITKI